MYLKRLTISIILFLSVYDLSAQKLKVESTAFANGHYIPYRYTCDAENINPGLRISGIPANAKSLVLIMLDTSVAFGVFDHWVVWNIEPTALIKENSKPGVTGRNSRKENKYTGPCPPNGVHEYHFRIYALNTLLNIADTSSKPSVINAMKGHVIDWGEAFGLFQRE